MIHADRPVRVWPGRPYPLGATWDGSGTNFSVFSEAADGIDLCLFDADGVEVRVRLNECIGSVWHGYLPDVGPGTRYGFRVLGERRVPGDLQCEARLLLDPYARAITGGIEWNDAIESSGESDGSPDGRVDTAPYVPRSVVVNPWFDWGEDRRPATPWHRTVLYEAHVKGLTMLHPEVPLEQRGTYLGLCAPPVIDHLHALGVTAVELMPCTSSCTTAVSSSSA